MAGEGFGQQDPSDSASKFNQQTFIIRRQLALISTMKIVLVKAIDADAGTVDVQPMVNQVDGKNNATPHGILLGIPYMQWRYGTAAILADPVVGDVGMMVCADRDSSTVLSTLEPGSPGSDRQLSASDGIYLGGFSNEEPEQTIEFTENGMELHDKNDNSLVSSSTGWEFTGPVKFNQLATFMGSIDVTGVAILRGGMQLSGAIVNIGGGTYTGNIETSGSIKSGAIDLQLHHHTAQGAFAATTAAQS